MRICLVRLPSPYLINEKAFPPLGLLAMATVLKANGHDVVVHDGTLLDIPEGFDAYGLGPSVTEYGYAREARDVIRKASPSSRIVIGGPHATLNVAECLRDGFDCVVTGDGEPVVNEAFTNASTFVQGGGEQSDLDDFPVIDRSFINLNNYKYYVDELLTPPVVSSKGCPFSCAFCSRVYRSVRMRSARHVIREIDYLHWDLGYGAVMFFDDTFVVDRRRVESISSHLRRLGMHWRCLVRGDLIVRYGADFVRMLASNGCVEVGMGIESGSDRILEIIGKRENIGTIRSAIDLLKSHGIRVKGFFIIGLPGETAETLAETDRFVESSGLDDMDFSIFKPYAGSRIHAHRDEYDIDWDPMDYSLTFYKGDGREAGGNIRTSRLSNAEIVSAMYAMEEKYKPAGWRQ
jgi:anaerobic magnesium-protoporphyrin IX monomethyl ester cyclase